jgi:hypothetical protein
MGSIVSLHCFEEKDGEIIIRGFIVYIASTDLIFAQNVTEEAGLELTGLNGQI